MRSSIHPLVFLLGSLLLSVTWLVLLAPPPTSQNVAAFGAGRPAAARPRVERKTTELDPEILRRYVGSYRLDVGMDVALEIDGGKLFATSDGQPRYELRPTSETEFYIPELDGEVAFDVDGVGRSAGFNVRLPTGTITAKRTR